MRVTIPPVVTVALLVSFTPLRANAQSDADTREVMAYRLTMPKLKQFNQALADYNRQREADPAYKRLQDKKRELARLNEKDELTEAEEERMAQLEAEIAEAEEAEETDDQDASLGEMADRLASDRWMGGALQRAGLAPREAATLQLALLQTMITVSMLDAGTIKEIPKEVNAENVRFYQANAAEIATLTALMNREGQEPN